MTHPTPSNSLAFVGRQPIVDRNLKLYGYELLFRDGATLSANVIDAEGATSQVICNTFMDLGLDNVVGQHLAFINLTRDFLLDPRPLGLPPERVVLEILEDVAVDQSLVNAVDELSHQGYVLALDDFVYDPAWEPLIDRAKFIKIDVLELDEVQVRKYVELLKPRGVKLLAEKVETKEEFNTYVEMGFELFQGYFFAKPTVLSGKRLPSRKLSALRLLTTLNNPDADMHELQAVISRDVGLSFRLLRYINSAAVGLRRRVDSLRQAVVLMGLNALRRWASLVVMSGSDDNSQALMEVILVRARMCELLCQQGGNCQNDVAFAAGLFSGLDALMNAPMNEILEQLPLSTELSNAILEHSGPAGQALACALAFERWDWGGAKFRRTWTMHK